MNILRITTISLFATLTFLSFGCSKVGEMVTTTGDLVSKTGKMIGGKDEKIEAPKIEIPEGNEIPKVIEIKEVKAATAKILVKTTSKLTQSRINVTVLQLKSDGKFLSSRLSDLESDAESVLGNDFVSKQSVSLKRGEQKALNIEIDSSTKAIGTFASFQELNQTIWRTGVQLPKATDTSYNIQIIVDDKLITANKS